MSTKGGRFVADPEPQAGPKLPGARTPRDPIDSATLLGGRDELTIDHFGQIYRLRVTRTGKLILTK